LGTASKRAIIARCTLIPEMAALMLFYCTLFSQPRCLVDQIAVALSCSSITNSRM